METSHSGGTVAAGGVKTKSQYFHVTLALVRMGGILAAEPEIVEDKKGYRTFTMAVAVDSIRMSEEGNERVNFHKVVGQKSLIVGLDLKKGDMVLITGDLENRSYEKADGTKAYLTEIVAYSVERWGPDNAKLKGYDLEDHESVCQCCEGVYDRTTEDLEVAESGEKICPTCWAK